MIVLLVALGGAVGAVARYSVGGWAQSLVGTTFPLGTMVVNVAGSFLLGLTISLTDHLALPAELRSLVAIGFLGAFTTFSTFSYEAVVLLSGGEWTRGALYVGGSLMLGIVGLLAGLALASILLQAKGVGT